jgi:LmbE family N-acetylglucosaminyl deacetylase
MKETIMVFCAHPDDEVIGAGGTLAKYAKEGKRTVCVIFTDGEASHPWEQKNYIVQKRRTEAYKSAKILQIAKLHHLHLQDGNIANEIKKPIVHQVLLDLLKKYKPTKVFTHDADDFLYGHTAVHKATVQAFDEYNAQLHPQKKSSLLTFNIWAFHIRKRDTPKMIVDITETFTQKKDALRCHKSQFMALIQLWPVVIIKALFSGFTHQTKYAEVFSKIR